MVSMVPEFALPATASASDPLAPPIPRAESSRPQLWTHLGIIAFIFTAALVLALQPQWILGHTSPCVMLSVFHIKCPFCGMTRDFVAILHGQLPTLNPSSWVSLAALYLGYPFAFLLAWRKRRLDNMFLQPVVCKVGLVCLVLMCIANNLQSR